MALLYTPEIRKIESRYVSLFGRTLLKALKGVPPASYKQAAKRQFRAASFRIQLDGIIDDLVLFTVDYADKEIDGFLRASRRHRNRRLNIAAAKQVLPLTEEAVRQSQELADQAVNSILELMREEGIYQEHPNKLAKRITDLWGGEKYRAVLFSRAFSADVATNTTLHRYRQRGISEWQFHAKIDEKTTDQCKMLHGTIFPTDSTGSEQYRPPLHFNCRSSMLPVPLTLEVDDKLRIQNRDFRKLTDQDHNFTDDSLPGDVVNDTLGKIAEHKRKYTFDKFILDEDLEKRLVKLGVGIEGKVPEIKKPKTKLTKEEKQIQKLQDEIADLEKEKAGLWDEIEKTKEELDKLETDPKNRELYKLYVEKEKEYYRLFDKYDRIKDAIAEKTTAIGKIQKEIIKQQLKREAEEAQQEFIKNMPKTRQPKADKVIKKIPDLKAKREKRAEAIVKKRLAVRDQVYDLREAYNKKEKELWDNYFDEKITEKDLERGLSLLKKDLSKIDKLEEQIKKLNEDQYKLRELTRKDIHKLLEINDGTPSRKFIKLDPRYSGPEDIDKPFIKRRSAEIEDVMDFFNKSLVQELRDSMPDIEIEELGSGGRAYTFKGANKVFLGNDDLADTLIHELGHNFEFNNVYMQESAYKHLITRTKDDALEKLRDVTGIKAYKDNEVTKKDKFFNPYVGKIYGDKTTEVTSMALQYLYKDPEFLYDNDPELFKWIVNAIRGHYLD